MFPGFSLKPITREGGVCVTCLTKELSVAKACSVFGRTNFCWVLSEPLHTPLLSIVTNIIIDPIKCNFWNLGVLTSYTGKPEIPAGKSNDSRHSFWERLQKIWAAIWGDAIFLLSKVCLADVDIFYSDTHSRNFAFNCFMFMPEISNRMVFVNGKHPSLSIFCVYITKS